MAVETEPGAEYTIATLVINGPQARPGGAIFVRHATLAFEWRGEGCQHYMYLKSGLLISACLLGVFLAACGDTGSTEETEPTASGPAITSPPADTPVPSVAGDSTPDSSMQSNPIQVTEEPGETTANTPTTASPAPSSPTPVPTATPVPEPTSTPSLKVGPEVGQAAPDFTVTTVDGEVLALSNFLGNKPFILYFFATW